MSEEKKSGARSLSFNIISNKTEHPGYGRGMIDLSNVSSIIIDGDEAYIDVGALHAKSKVEKGIKFSPDKADTPNGRQCWLVWVAVGKNDEGKSFYAGLTACEMLIDTEARRGWKILADHVNKMDYAMKRKYILDGLGDKAKQLLRNLLMEHNPEWWDQSPDDLKRQLS